MTGMTLRIFPEGVDTLEPVAEVTTDDDGRYAFESLPAGTYRVEVVTANDVVVKVARDVRVSMDNDGLEDVVIAPMGRIYDSVSGVLLDGATVTLYEDLDVDDDPMTPIQSLNVCASTQVNLNIHLNKNQRTAHGGLYHFVVREPGRYLIEVQPGGSAM